MTEHDAEDLSNIIRSDVSMSVTVLPGEFPLHGLLQRGIGGAAVVVLVYIHPQLGFAVGALRA